MTFNIYITEEDDNYGSNRVNNYIVINEVPTDDQYLPEGSSLTAKNRFEYDDTASVDVLKLNSTSGETYSKSVIVLRTSGDESKIKLERDGWFTAIHVVIPTQDWVYKEIAKTGSIIRTYDIVYFTDGKNLYTYYDGLINTCNLDDLLAETSTNTTISRCDKDYFSIRIIQENIDERFLNLYKKRLNLQNSSSANLRVQNSSYVSKWSQHSITSDDNEGTACDANRLVTDLNLIKHYVRWGQLAEAERIVERMNTLYGGAELQILPGIYRGCGCVKFV